MVKKPQRKRKKAEKTMTTILDYLIEQSVINPVQSEKEKFFQSFKPTDFPDDCEDLGLFSAFSEVFGVPESILVFFQNSLPVRVLFPSLWADDGNIKLYLGNLKFPISAEEKSGKWELFIFAKNSTKVFLDWDTEVRQGKLNLFFSFSYKGTEIPLYPVFDHIEDGDTKAKESLAANLEQVKKFLKNGEYSDALKLFSSLLKLIPSFDNEATITHLFLPLFKEDWKDFKKNHPSPIPVILAKPQATTDQFGKVVKFSIDAEELAKRLNLSEDYLVYSWGKFKPLRDINCVTFNHSMIKSHAILQKIHAGEIKLKYLVCYIIAPNNTRIEWPPVLSFLLDSSVEKNAEIRKSLSSILDAINPNLIGSNELPSLDTVDNTAGTETAKLKFEVPKNFGFE